MSAPLTIFYEEVRSFLLKSGLETEQSLCGYSTSEIELVEQEWNVKFPEAYGLFLKTFGKTSNCLMEYDFSFAVLPWARKLSQEIEKRNKLNLDGWFPFTERQWYSFQSWKLGSANIENPEVMLVVEGDEGVETHYYATFTGWLLKNLENYLNALANLNKVSVDKQWELFQKLRLSY